MTSFFDYEKANNELINQLRIPQWSATVEAILSRQAILLVPHSVSLGSIKLTKEFLSCHIVLRNPSNSKELITVNGIYLVLVEEPNSLNVLHVLSNPNQSPPDVNVAFRTSRQFLDNYYNSNQQRILQAIQVLREGHIELKGRSVPVLLMEQPILFPGCGWTRESIKTVDFSEEKPVATPPRNSQSTSSPSPSPSPQLIPTQQTQPPPSPILQQLQQPIQPLLQQQPLQQLQQQLSDSKVGASLTNWLFGETNTDATNNPSNSTPSNTSGIPTLNFLPSPAASPAKTSAKKIANYKDLFWSKIKDKAANEVYNKLTSFVTKFLKHPPNAADQGQILQDTIQDILELMKKTELWKNSSHEELEASWDCLEKYIMVKIYNCCFAPLPEDLAKDKEMTTRIQQLSWLTPDHLDIRAYHRNSRRFNIAVSELRKMDSYKAPKDKMICLLNACKALYYILNKASSRGNPAGADEFLPLLIYTVVKANPPRLHSNIQYIQEFRRSTSLITEAGYYLTHLVSATMFIEGVDASQLNIDPEEFNRLMTMSSIHTTSDLDKRDTAEEETGAEEEDDLHLTRAATQPLPRKQSHQQPHQPQSQGFSTRDSSASSSYSHGMFSQGSQATRGESSYDPSSPFPSTSHNDEAFYRSIQSDLEKKRFMVCNAEDLRIGEVATLLHMFRALSRENEALKEELDKFRQ